MVADVAALRVDEDVPAAEGKAAPRVSMAPGATRGYLTLPPRPERCYFGGCSLLLPLQRPGGALPTQDGTVRAGAELPPKEVCAPFVRPHFENVAAQLPLADL